MARLRSSFRLPMLALGAILACSAIACNRVRVDEVRGPDGREWARISCRRMDKKCFRAAATLCPSGYYFTKAGDAATAPVNAPANDDDDNDDDASSSRVVRSAPHPQAGINAKTLPPQERWSSRMYSRRPGTLLVQCATTASNER